MPLRDENVEPQVATISVIAQTLGHVPFRLVVQQCSVHCCVSRHDDIVIHRGIAIIDIVCPQAHTPSLR